jgi:Tol biopolymer transport system component
MREIRISPDGEMVAIRSDKPDTEWDAWGVMHFNRGGHWRTTAEVEGWTVVSGE